jgi:hypothetical protein
MILSRAQVLFGSEPKARDSEMIDGTAGFLDRNRAELGRSSNCGSEKKVFKTFQNFFALLGSPNVP